MLTGLLLQAISFPRKGCKFTVCGEPPVVVEIDNPLNYAAPKADGKLQFTLTGRLTDLADKPVALAAIEGAAWVGEIESHAGGSFRVPLAVTEGDAIHKSVFRGANGGLARAGIYLTQQYLPYTIALTTDEYRGRPAGDKVAAVVTGSVQDETGTALSAAQLAAGEFPLQVRSSRQPETVISGSSVDIVGHEFTLPVKLAPGPYDLVWQTDAAKASQEVIVTAEQPIDMAIDAGQYLLSEWDGAQKKLIVYGDYRLLPDSKNAAGVSGKRLPLRLQRPDSASMVGKPLQETDGSHYVLVNGLRHDTNLSAHQMPLAGKLFFSLSRGLLFLVIGATL